MAHRSERMRAELGRRKTVTEAIYEAGFNSNGRFYANSSGMLGMKPKDYQNGGRGAAIRFAVGKCSLGSILVAASEQGICAIFLGDDPAALTNDLAKRFPKAQLIAADRKISRSRRQGDPLRRGSADRFGSAARSPRNRLSAPSLGGSSRDSRSARSPVIRRSPSAIGALKGSSRRCAGNCLQSAGGCHSLPSRLMPGREHFRLSLGRRTQEFPAKERTDRAGRLNRSILFAKRRKGLAKSAISSPMALATPIVLPSPMVGNAIDCDCFHYDRPQIHATSGSRS